jgi:glycogen debranching enzyme
VGARVQPAQRYAWRGRSLLVTTPRLECDDSDGLTGWFFREARHLRTLRLTVNGVAPWLCAEGDAASDELAAAYVYPELTSFGGGGTDASDDTTWCDEHGVPQRAVDVRVRLRAVPNGLDVELTLANRSREPLTLDVAWHLGADFADIQESFTGERQQEAPVEAEADGDAIVFHYRHERLPLATRVYGEGAAWRPTARRNALAARVAIAPGASHVSRLRVDPGDPDGDIVDERVRQRNAVAEAWRGRVVTVHTPGDAVAGEIVNQAAADLGALALLDGRDDECLAVQAGIPLYPALFGRDALVVGWQAAMFDRGELLDAALTRLGRMQSDHFDEWRDAEPGRIPYQIRSGPLARLGANPYDAYYADFASPLDFVIAMAHHFAWSGDRDFLRRHWDVARRILDWARTLGDRDGDGYLEYQTRSTKGTKNQGWKDSGNAIVYEDGEPVPAPLGTCELQGYWFAAQQLMAALSWVAGAHEDARAYWRSASELKERFNRDWWLDDESCVALARDADGRLARSVTSNAGQCLATGIVADEHVPPLVGRLFAPDLFSGWGIRTLSTAHVAYNPLAYHLGTVWPVENATIVLGLRRYGFDARAVELASAMFALARLYPRGRVPECVGGYARGEFPHPGAYPRANPIQTWNQSALLLVVQCLLGCQPVAPLHTLFVDPVLPAWLPEVIVRDLRLGGATATIRCWRDDDGASHAEVVEKRGTLHLVRQPPPESLRDGLRDRLGALVETVRHH